jgi:hypothetical protein
MMDSVTDQAERTIRRRARVSTVLALLFIGLQGVYFGKSIKFDALGAGGAPDGLRISAWLVMALVLLFLLLTGGGLLQSRAVRRLANDESTREHRRQAFATGFLAMIACGLGLYVLASFEPIAGPEVVHLMLTVGVGAALLSFGAQERRALADG